MNTPQNGNGIEDPPRRNSANDAPDDVGEYPGAIMAVAHRDPDTFLEFIHVLDRLLSRAGAERFSPCAHACPSLPPRALAQSELLAVRR